MGIRISTETRKLIQQEFARAGGKARAKKYDHATLSEWAKLGGRPRKKDAQVQDEQGHSAPSRSRRRRK